MKTLKKLFYCLLMFGLLLAISSTAFAQTSEKKSLTLNGAERVISAAKAEAAKVKAPGGVIAVVDAGGNLMALERLDGTCADGIVSVTRQHSGGRIAEVSLFAIPRSLVSLRVAAPWILNPATPHPHRN